MVKSKQPASLSRAIGLSDYCSMAKGLLTTYYPDYDYSTATFRVQFIVPRVDELAKLEPVRDLLHYDEGACRFALID
jgi:hypothetical protein